ncbi:FAD-dependent monooxygenase [Streptomyces sp. NPDC000410]|uniref:FAD-dependent monooxygenase n=1 Tax=Streptomyces sp. NPDC000410 TaxID=3154254 RepID=UPI0033259F22
MNVYDTDVLVVGGGPVGLALALDLALRGVDFVLVESGDGTVHHPKVSTVGPRAMELFRRWGVAERIRGAGWPGDHTLDVAWVTAVGGHELHRLDFGTMATRPQPDHSPETEAICPQHWLAPLLTGHVGVHPRGPVRLHTRLTAFTQDDAGVHATLADERSGTTTLLRARYLAACDGASSTVRKHCRVDAPERHPTRVLRNILFSAPKLHDQLGPRAALVYFVTRSASLRYPLRAIDGRGLYRLTAAPTCDDPLSVVREAIGVDTPLEMLSTSTWHLTHRVATSFRAGRVFLVGDAAHTLSPSGGFGLGTGIGDAADLGWKLAAELAGWAGPGLLDTYDTERRPVAVAGLEEANRNLRRTQDRRLSFALALDSAEGERARAELSALLERSGVRREFDAPDVHFAQRYVSPVIVPDGTDGTDGTDATGAASAWDRTAAPGGRAPHVWLGPGRSTIDLFGRDFVLMCAAGPGEGPDPMARAFADRGVPLRIERYDDPEVARRYERRFVLVRPDGHVAWRGDTAPGAPDRLVETVRGAAR